MKKPVVIGVSGSIMKDSGGMFPGYPRSYINHDYMRSISENGGIPLMLPCLEEKEGSAILEAWIQQIDGLILSGGHDLFPPLFGEECKQKLTEVYPERDVQELALLELARKYKKPVWGICRGFQLIHAHFGSKILQDLSYADRELLKHWQGHSPTLATQEVHLEAGNLFSDLFGQSVWVNSFHHQVVVEAGPDLQVCGRTSDGVIEAAVHKTEDIMGTQWHPEMMSATSLEMKKLFRFFIEKCETKKER